MSDSIETPETVTAPSASAGSTLAGKWSVSTNEEIYYGVFDTMEQAIEDGRLHRSRFWVGQCISPIQPEELFDEYSIASWLETSVYEHDDYVGEWAEDAVAASDDQRAELAADIRPLIAAWLDRHKLRPTHWNIDPVSVRQIDA